MARLLVWKNTATSIVRDGSPLQLTGMSIDVTERERSAVASLRLGQRDDAILTVDECGTVTSVNQSTERLFGYTQADLLSKNVQVLVHDFNAERYDRRESDLVSTVFKRSALVVK